MACFCNLQILSDCFSLRWQRWIQVNGIDKWITMEFPIAAFRFTHHRSSFHVAFELESGIQRSVTVGIAAHLWRRDPENVCD